ncbi:30S ribosomal protein S7 [Candidatus Roizmanbacteria bacterium]|nr:30S ribosomal protein S7 [Candidatus Roizmanbacteria bacterium]
MPRHPYKKKTIEVDPVYESYEVAKFINYIMYNGKKDVASQIVYDTFEEIKKTGEEPMKVFMKAISNVAPDLEVRPRRLGGASYLVPAEVRKDRKIYLALHWIIEAARARSNKEFKEFTGKLVSELLEASKNQGQAVNKRLQAEKVAEANKAFSHLKW